MLGCGVPRVCFSFQGNYKIQNHTSSKCLLSLWYFRINFSFIKISKNKFSSYFTDLVHCTNEPNVSIPQLANLMVERSQNANWIVVYKSLISVHHLMAYGNEVSISRLFFLKSIDRRLLDLSNPMFVENVKKTEELSKALAECWINYLKSFIRIFSRI